MRSILWGSIYAFAALPGFTPTVYGSDYAFWVWHRRDPLTAKEKQALTPLRALLFWHMGELDLSTSGGKWRWRDPVPVSSVPVIRINIMGGDPFAQPGLVDSLAKLADAQGRLQIDCDCPDRLLTRYARFLKELRAKVPGLSVTALAGWSRHPAFPALQEAAGELLPMFYDLTPDPPRIGPDAPPLPLLELKAFTRQFAPWKECKARWWAGLPNFSRMTLYDREGRFLGHPRNSSWDDVVFQRTLRFVAAPGPGVVLLKAESDFMLNETPVKAGSTIAVRWVDATVLSQALEAVKESSAKGVALFRLPDSADISGWSISQLRTLADGTNQTTTLRLHRQGEQLVLKNESDADLPPRLKGDAPLDRGYALEIDAPEQIWREALAGDFWRVAAHADPDGQAVAVAVPLATRLTFWFSALRAGESVRSGLIQFAPGTDFRQIRYRILPGDQKWNRFEE